MATYSIRDLEELSGIKAHTIRIWEQRHQLIQPKRTATNIRFYDNQDLRQLLSIAVLNRNGIKISHIKLMNSEEIATKVAAISSVNFEKDVQLDALTISMVEMDEVKFENLINAYIQEKGFEQTMLQIINPFLEKLHQLWLSAAIHPAQEHFISHLIQRKLIVAIDKEPYQYDKNVDSFLLFLPEGHYNELSLLFFYYLIKKRAKRVIYLGANISIDNLKSVYKIHSPKYICTMLLDFLPKKINTDYIKDLAITFPDSTILLAKKNYSAVSYTHTHENIVTLSSPEEAIEFLEKN